MRETTRWSPESTWFFATMVVAINLLIDLIYPYLDPRVRYS